MATFLGAIEVLSSLGFYAYIFPFILIFAITYGILTSFKPFGSDQRVNLIVATVTGFLFISLSSAVAFMNMFMPFFMIALIIFLFVLMAFKFGGVSEETIVKTLQHPAGYGLILGVLVIIIAVTVTYTQPQIFDIVQPINESEVSPEGFALTPEALMKQTTQTLYHPTIIGIIIMFVVFAVTVYMVTHKGAGG